MQMKLGIEMTLTLAWLSPKANNGSSRSSIPTDVPGGHEPLHDHAFVSAVTGF